MTLIAQPSLRAPGRLSVIGKLKAMSPGLRLGLLAVVALACMVVFMAIRVRTDWAFVLQYRGSKLAAMVLVAYAVGVSTVLFHSITHNRILTPAIMGFDALYLLIQTSLVYVFGMQTVASFNPAWKFAGETAVMVLMAFVLFRTMFSGAMRSLHLMLLVGVVLGVLFRALTSLMLRLIDPSEFGSLQDRFFASFNLVAVDLLASSAVALVLVSLFLWRIRHSFDVVALGRDIAINLGVDYPKRVMQILFCIAVLVSVSTALVGPVTFLGLLVSNLAYQLIGNMRHRYSLPAAVLLGVVALVGGQLVLEHVLGYNSALSMVIEFVGGLVFLLLLLGGKKR